MPAAFNPGIAIVGLDDVVGHKLLVLGHHGVFHAAANEALDCKECVFRVGHALPFGGLAYQGFAFGVESDDRRGCAGPFRIFDNLGGLALHDGDARVCRSKVNTNNFSHVFSPLGRQHAKSPIRRLQSRCLLCDPHMVRLFPDSKGKIVRAVYSGMFLWQQENRRVKIPMRYLPEFLDRSAQEQVLRDLREAVAVAPLFTPVMPRTAKPFSVRMTNMGSLGWVSDRAGYRYQASHPEPRDPWPAIPQSILSVWNRVSNYAHPPEACLVNFYGSDAKMGLHQDRDEEDFEAPVVSISLGDTALFRVGGTTRGGKTQSLKLASGDVLILEGPTRLAFHGIDRVIGGSSTLLKDGGRINLTLRRVTKP